MRYSLPKPLVDRDVEVCFQIMLSNFHNLFGEPNGSDHHKKYNLNGSRGSFGRTKEGSLDNLRKGQMKNVLLIGTGALMSPLTAFQGESIPSIAHCIEICAENFDSEGTQNAVADIS